MYMNIYFFCSIIDKICNEISLYIVHADDLEDEERSSSSSDHDGEDCNGAIHKLTRAQRKRLRRKKLKEESSQRRKIIGPMPLLSNANDGGNGGGGDVVRKALENVRQNASVETDTVMEKSG